MIVVKCETWPDRAAYTVIFERVDGFKRTPIYETRITNPGGHYDVTYALAMATAQLQAFGKIWAKPEKEITI